jgi:hypothetical protein
MYELAGNFNIPVLPQRRLCERLAPELVGEGLQETDLPSERWGPEICTPPWPWHTEECTLFGEEGSAALAIRASNWRAIMGADSINGSKDLVQSIVSHCGPRIECPEHFLKVTAFWRRRTLCPTY